MQAPYFWGIPRFSGGKGGIIVRISLVLFVVATSITLAWTLLNTQRPAHATSVSETPTAQEPWGVAFDTAGHIWVAEPGCTALPVCSPPLPSGILGEFNTADGSKVQEYSSAPSTFLPQYLAVDGSGNVWFSDPTNNALGELMPGGGGSWQEFTAGLSAGAEPYDLTFDGAGNLWFTERAANKIGFFNPSTHTFQESTVGSGNTRPYGIAYDSVNNVIWFADAGTANIGSFPPTATGVLSAGTVSMHSVINRQYFPRLIAIDKQQNIWFSEGYAGYIGELPHGSTTAKDYPICASQPCGDLIIGIGVDSNGTVWFTNSQFRSVGALTPATDTVTWFPLPGSTAFPRDGLGVDSADNVWFTDEYTHNLGRLPAGSVSPLTPASGPVSTQWFFGEGRVGAGFTEWLTLGNPTNASCQVDLRYLYTPDGGGPQSKALVISVPAHARETQSVNQDLGITATGVGNSVSATVSVDTNATPQCSGIVAERPIYNTTFGNPLGVNSGTDVIGATHTGTSFYFADLRTGPQAGGGSASSFIPILNPGTSPATVTATYFVGGQQVGVQSTVVPAGSRGTLYPDAASLPARVAASVTSDQPVLVERPSYFNRVVMGNAGSVSGEADVVGVQQPAADFLFAEGYTGGRFQEYLVLANFDPLTDISGATLLLEYANGATFSFPVAIPHRGQATLDINQLTANPGGAGGTCLTALCLTTQDVSMEVKAAAGTFVAERELFFQYAHTANGRSLAAAGASDVIGQVGPAAATAYSFAEGYTGVGYDEWLTLQNPTATAETITVTLANADGHIYTFQVQVGANTRSTVGITGMVLAHLIVPGDTVKGYEVSMAVQSAGGPFVAERPMYFNASGQQGGSDVIGYLGG